MNIVSGIDTVHMLLNYLKDLYKYLLLKLKICTHGNQGINIFNISERDFKLAVPG